MGPQFNLNSIVTFLAVAETGSFRAASERLHTSSSAVSARIKLLEERLGVRVFDRTTRSVALTHAGKQLMEAALGACTRLTAVERTLRQEAALQRGEVTLAVVPSLAQGEIPMVLAEFRQAHPGIRIKVVDVDSARSLNMLEHAEVDLAIVSKPGNQERFVFEPLYWDPCMVVAPREHAVAKMKSISIRALVNYPLMVNRQGTTLRTMLSDAFSNAGLKLEPDQEISTTPALVRMAAAGFGLGIAPSKSLEGLSGQGCMLVPIEDRIGWTVGIARLAASSLAPAGIALQARLISYYTQSPSADLLGRHP